MTHKRVVTVVILISGFSLVLSFVRLFIERNISYAIFAIIGISFLLTTRYMQPCDTTQTRFKPCRVQQEAHNGENTASLRKFATGTFVVYLAFLVCYLPESVLSLPLQSLDQVPL